MRLQARGRISWRSTVVIGAPKGSLGLQAYKYDLRDRHVKGPP